MEQLGRRQIEVVTDLTEPDELSTPPDTGLTAVAGSDPYDDFIRLTAGRLSIERQAKRSCARSLHQCRRRERQDVPSDSGAERPLSEGAAKPVGVIATTFTVKAASQLHDRVRKRLIESGRAPLAEQMAQALVGTVHSVCERLLARFAFDLGLSPELNVASVEDGARLFNQALDEVLSADRVREMNLRAARLDLIDDRSGRSWQDHVKKIADQARSNDIDAAVLAAMGQESADRFLGHFPEPTCDEQAAAALIAATREAIASIDLESDTTKGTAEYVGTLRGAVATLRHDECPWTLWIGLSKKSPDEEESGQCDPGCRLRLPATTATPGSMRTFGITSRACSRLRERPLPASRPSRPSAGSSTTKTWSSSRSGHSTSPRLPERLDDELELLLVDEFQDTNPMQLALFMKLARFAREVIFVGDVKQSIYGFRGSDPELVHRTLDALRERGCSLEVLRFLLAVAPTAGAVPEHRVHSRVQSRRHRP